MKKNVKSFVALLVISATATAQQPVLLNGQQFAQGDWIGSTNNAPVTFKANNIIGLRIRPDGQLVFKSLELNNGTATNGLVLTDGQGKISRLDFSGSGEQVLMGNGTWGTLPTTSQWSASGNNLYWDHGNVGIGAAPADAFKLDVTGDARISNNLFVEHLSVTGFARMQGAAQFDQGITFDGSNGIKFIPNADGGGTFRYGKGGGQPPAAVPCAAQPYSPVNHSFGGWVQIYDADASGNYIPGSGLLNFQAWSGGSSIDASIGGNLGGGGLLLNYFCHNNTFINTGWDIANGIDGGTIYMGAKVDMQNSLKIGWNPNPTIDLNTSIDVNQYTNNARVLQLNTWNNSVKFLSINNSNFTKSPFTVYADGRTYIGAKDQAASPNHYDALLTVNGKMVTKSCYVTLNSWADYVFADDYCLPDLSEIESYYKTNKHLPEIPSEKEVLENGLDVAEMNKLLLKKVEELTILMVEQNKKLEQYKSEMEVLKAAIRK